MNVRTAESPIRVLICDLDNTLYDWVAYFVPTFYAMVDEIIKITGWERDELLDDFREVHQRHHNVEHPFSFLETKLVRDHFGGLSKADIAEKFNPAFHAFNSIRKKTLVAYPGVSQTLAKIQDTGITLVAHTDSDLHAVIDRLRRLELSDYFTHVYCRSRGRPEHPTGIKLEEWAKGFPLDRVIELPNTRRKPDPKIIREICSRLDVEPAHVAYVGDSIARDIYMAKKGGAQSIWAEYGTRHPSGMYDQLVRITHWTEEDIIREKTLSAESVGTKPDFVLRESFEEILPYLT